MLWIGVLIAVFAGSALLSMAVLDADRNGTVETGIGTFSTSFFKIPNDREAWMGFTVPVEPGTARVVTEPVIPVEGAEEFPSWYYRSNSDGIRDEEVPAEKPANTTRILVLGNSVTMGNLVNESARFTELLQARLENGSARDYRVINAGVPSAGMFDHHLFLRTIGLDYRPDVVIVQFGRLSDISRAENRRLALTLQNMTDSMEAARDAEITIGGRYLDRLTWQESEVRTIGARIAALAHANNITPVFLTTEDVEHERLERYRRWAAENGAVFVGPPPRFRENDREVYRFADGHYRANGHRWLATHLDAELAPVPGDTGG